MMILISQSLASDCDRISKIEQFNLADAVIVGKVLYSTDDYHQIGVVEKFKGTVGDTIKLFLNQYSIYVKENETWLMYLKLGSDNYFYSNYCSGSKSFTTPIGVNDYSFPEPPPYFKEESIKYLTGVVLKSRSLNELYFDILNLRQIKMQKEAGALKMDYKELKGQYSEISNQYEMLLKALVGLVVILILLGAVIVWRTRKVDPR